MTNLSKHQRDALKKMRAMGIAIDSTRVSNDTHLFVYATTPAGVRFHITVQRDFGDFRAQKNFDARLRRLLKEPQHDEASGNVVFP